RRRATLTCVPDRLEAQIHAIIGPGMTGDDDDNREDGPRPGTSGPAGSRNAPQTMDVELEELEETRNSSPPSDQGTPLEPPASRPDTLDSILEELDEEVR